MKTIGSITHGTTRKFQGAIFLNDPSIAYEILDSHLDSGWYPEPENTTNEWTDIAVLNGKFYACFGEDSVMTDSEIIYIEIEPTSSMVKEYEYRNQY